MRQGIFWIASYPRSGNTWTRAFLAALEDTLAGRPTSASRLIGVSERSFDGGELSPENLKKRLTLQIQHANQAPGLRFLKTHSARVAFAGLPTIALSVSRGAVYLVRDPRDVAISYTNMFGVDLDAVVYGMGKSGWVSGASGIGGFELVCSWSENVRSWCDQPDTLVIRYEDLHAAPAKHFRELADAVGWRPTLTQLASAVAAVSFDRMQAARKSTPDAMEGIAIAHGVAGRWREVLTAAQARRIEQDHRELMTRFGYL